MKYSIVNNCFESITNNPEKIAICSGNETITWQQLYNEVYKIGALIDNLAIPAGHPVILYGHKEIGFVAGMIALMMRDIPYVPIDKTIPFERAKQILQVLKSQVVIDFTPNTKNDFDSPITIKRGLIITKAQPVYLGNIYWYEKDPLRYIMFTSGSTGEPKGVQITREAVASFVDWIKTDFEFTFDDVYMNQAPFSFDVSMYELYGFLVNGGTLVLNTDKEYRDPDIFLDRIKKYECSVWVSTPTFAYMYLSDPRFNSNHLPSLKTFLFCGESLPKKTAKILLERFPDSRVLNTYGPTEATVATTLIDVTAEVLEKYKDMPVGYAKYTSKVLINDENHDQSEPGEIVIVGDNISIGYFNNPELNNQKYFIHNGQRAFRTGDYGYYKDNILFFSGRKDEQVKLHGYRIELGDINTQIAKHPAVKEAVTVPLKAGDTVKKLISFVQLKSHEAADNKPLKKDIIETIKKVLPEYMIPGDIMMVSEFPVNNNLKIDKSKLIELYLASA